jgi:hypothetical protein
MDQSGIARFAVPSRQAHPKSALPRTLLLFISARKPLKYNTLLVNKFFRTSLLAQPAGIAHIRSIVAPLLNPGRKRARCPLQIFCSHCGKPLPQGAAFCGACSAAASGTQPPAGRASQPAPAPVYAAAGPTPGAASRSGGWKIALVAAIAILFVGGALALGAVYYAAHRVHARIQAMASDPAAGTGAASGLAGKLEQLAQSSSTQDSSLAKSGDNSGNPCRYLTREDVGSAIGTPVTRVDMQADGCVYYAHGDPASMVTKHTGALLAGKGASPAAQQMAEKIAGAFFQQQQNSDKNLSAEAATGEVPVLTLSFSRGNAAAEMSLNEKMMRNLGSGPQPVEGVGDQAFSLAETSMTFRKGDTLVRLMYPECPCNTQSITPLARKLAARL